MRKQIPATLTLSNTTNGNVAFKARPIFGSHFVTCAEHFSLFLASLRPGEDDVSEEVLRETKHRGCSARGHCRGDASKPRSPVFQGEITLPAL